MRIHFDEAHRLFHLRTSDMSYVFGIAADGRLRHLYWGPSLSSDDSLLPLAETMLAAYEPSKGVDARKDGVAELLKQCADGVTDEMLALLETENAPYALEILSGTKKRDERVYRALLDAFLTAGEEDMPLYAGYLAAYGDGRAIPELLRAIEREDIGFVAFQELKFAIEALGGEYEKQRDFSQDEQYKKIMAASAGSDIFGMKKK